MSSAPDHVEAARNPEVRSHARNGDRHSDPGAAPSNLAVGGAKLAPEIAEKVKFIPGSSITDMLGEDLTDGILGWREGNQLHVLNIFEVKSAQRVSPQLWRRWRFRRRNFPAAWTLWDRRTC